MQPISCWLSLLHPQPLAIGVPEAGHIAIARTKSLGPRPGHHLGDVLRGKGSDQPSRPSGAVMAIVLNHASTTTRVPGVSSLLPAASVGAALIPAPAPWCSIWCWP